MKYSIIIPYRKREWQLQYILPRLHQKFADKDYEIIVVEQDDDDLFCIAPLQNIGFQHATGDVIVFQQVDYYPSDDVSYEPTHDVVLPAHRGIFVNKDFERVVIDDIPPYYRTPDGVFREEFYGGVVVFTRAAFEKVGGYNPLFVGWGNEDDEMRLRVVRHKLHEHRNSVGTFYVFNHPDNNPIDTAAGLAKRAAYIEGRYVLEHADTFHAVGMHNQTATTKRFHTDDPRLVWIKATNFKTHGLSSEQQHFLQVLPRLTEVTP